MKKITISVLSFLSLILTSCYYDNFKELHPQVSTTGCDTSVTMSYATHIVPVLNTSCNVQCHGGTGGGSGHDMSTWAAVNADATAGSLVSSIVWDGNAQQMPQGATTKISPCDIAKIKKWVAAGALNN